MGVSCCKIRHNTSTNPTRPLHSPRPPQPSSTPNHPSSTSHHLPLPCPPPPSHAFASSAPYPSFPQSNPPPSHAFLSSAPYPSFPQSNPPPSHAFLSSAPYPSFPQSNTHHSNLQNSLSYSSPHLGGQPNYSNQGTWQAGFFPGVPRPQPPPYVDHQNAKKIKNEVNVHKDTIRVELDEKNVDYHLVSFTFDALVDGSFTIIYFAKEGTDCTFTPLYPGIHMPVRVSFNKGLGQKFCQSPGTGIDLGFFDTDVLSNPSSKEEIFPLVISAQIDEKLEQPLPPTSPLAQITQAVLERNNENHFQVKVFKQILWVDRVRYELREIYGISNSDELGFDENGQGKECVICMSEPKDTAVLPCRHMCMCSGCAKELRLQSNKCPICRQPIHELIEIKVDKEFYTNSI